MEKSKRKNAPTLIGIFKTKVKTKMIALVLMIVPIIIFGVMFRNGLLKSINDLGAFSLVVIPLLAIVIYVNYLYATQSIYIYEDGIEHHYGSSRHFARWEDLSYFETRGNKNSHTVGIGSVEPLAKYTNKYSLDGLLHYNWDDHFMELSHVIKIPIQKTDSHEWLVDIAKLKDTEFGHILYDYAPHLFEGEGS